MNDKKNITYIKPMINKTSNILHIIIVKFKKNPPESYKNPPVLFKKIIHNL